MVKYGEVLYLSELRLGKRSQKPDTGVVRSSLEQQRTEQKCLRISNSLQVWSN